MIEYYIIGILLGGFTGFSIGIGYAQNKNQRGHCLV